MPTKKTIAFALLAASVLCWAASPAAAKDWITTIVTDADARVEADWWGCANSGNNYGAETGLTVGLGDWNRKFYVHFDLGGVPHPALEVTGAQLRIEWENTSYPPSETNVYAIMDKTKDWDLAALPETGAGSITFDNAPQCPACNEWSFLEEGTGVDAVTRLIGQVENPGPQGSPPPSPIDLDVTDLVKWLLGQDDAYSSLPRTDTQLTVCARENADYCYAEYYSREQTPGDDGDAPRLVITQYLIDGDATFDGCVDGLDYVAWSNNYNQSNMQWEDGDFNDDDKVDGLDYIIWSNNYLVGCPPSAPAAVPEPGTLSLVVIGACLRLLRRRRR